jgi:hypothetical protein
MIRSVAATTALVVRGSPVLEKGEDVVIEARHCDCGVQTACLVTRRETGWVSRAEPETR